MDLVTPSVNMQDTRPLALPAGMADRGVAGATRILYVLGRMQPGGIEVRLLDVMRRLPPSSFHVDVCALSGLEGSLDREVRALGGQVIHLPLKSLEFARRFMQLLRQNDYQVVHANVHLSSGVILALAGRVGVPVRVANFHVTEDGQLSTFRRRAQRQAMKLLIKRYATDIIGCCETVLEEAWSASWRSDPRCRAIYYGAEVPTFDRVSARSALRAELGIPEEAPIYLHLGRCSPARQKNHGRLLSIFAEMRHLMPSAWLVMAGQGTDDPAGEVVPRIAELGLQDRVAALGVRSDVTRLLAASDAMLLPSLFEGLPNVVLEACATGIPVLATDLGGVLEIASRLSLVRCLPLSASDAEWALAASRLPAEAEQLHLKETAADAFGASPFHLDRAADAHRLLWRRAAPLELLACS